MGQNSGYSLQLLSILIVDGSHDLLDDDRLLLEQEGFEVYYVQSGSEAVALLSKISEPNLIMLDKTLQDMSANQFLNLLQEKFPEIIQSVPIVLLTNQDSDYVQQDGTRVKKPIIVEKLLSEVHRFIENRYLTPTMN